MKTWSCPYRDPVRILTGLLAGFASVLVLAGAFAGGMAVSGRLSVPSTALPSTDVVILVAIFAVGWLIWVWRLHRVALVIGQQGVRLRWVWRTRTVAWSGITRFGIQRDEVRPRMVIVLKDATEVRTPVVSVDLLTIFIHWFDAGRVWLGEEDFLRLGAELQSRLDTELDR